MVNLDLANQTDMTSLSVVEHIFNYSQPRCCLFAAVIATDVFLKAFIFVSTHHRCHVVSKTGLKQDSPNPNPDSLCIQIRIC